MNDLDPQRFRRVLGHFPTGVVIVTTMTESGEPEGMVVGSFTSVSLEPPLVAFLPSSSSSSWARIRPTGRFCVNILGADDELLCRQFATRKGAEKYDGVTWRPSPSGAPIIDGAVAWIDCVTDTVHPAGDHDIVVGQVQDLEVESDRLPLLFFQGGYGSFTPRTLLVADSTYQGEVALVDRARHLIEAAARGLQGQVAVAHCDGSQLTFLASAGSRNERTMPQAALGEPVSLVAPVGIWWMSQADPAQVEPWLDSLPTPADRDRVRDALELIRRDQGLTVGLDAVHDGLGQLLADRAAGRRLSERDEAAALSGLVSDPLSFVASRFAPTETAADHPEVRSIWCPVPSAAEPVTLGVMATDFSPVQPLAEVTRHVRGLAAGIAALAETPLTTGEFV